MGKIQELPKASSRLLTSSQIITSVYCVVKELIENALDSCAKSVEVKLEDYGLEKIEVKDNGCGIIKDDIQFVAKPHFTSKLSCYSDLEKVSTYGFRGEALGAVCAVAELVITTKSSDESTGNVVIFNHEGTVTSTKPFPCAQGTTVSVKNLFKNIPVRRQYYRSEKNKKDGLRKVEDLLIAFGCIQNDVRFALFHNQNMIWQKPSLSTTKNALIHVLGNSVADHLKHAEYVDENTQRMVEIFLPKLEAPLNCSLSTSSRCITAINRRPVKMKAVDKILKEHFNKAILNSGKSRYPICFISITTPLTEVDVNIEPNKTTVMLHNSEEILTQFSEMLKTFYSSEVSENNIENNIPPENPMSNSNNTSNPSDFLNSLKVTCDAKLQQSKLSFTPNTPASLLNSSVNGSANIVRSSQKTDTSMKQKDITVLDTPKEPRKKKLKSKLSKSDITDHISTLKNFFTSEENSASLSPNSLPNSIHGTPTVTVERMRSEQNNVSSEADQVVRSIDSDRITTFAVSENLSSKINSFSNGDCANNRKRHLSESSILAERNEDFSKKPSLNLNKQDANAWSRGVHPSGGLLQPVEVLHPKPVNIPEASSSDKKGSVNNKKESPQKKNSSFERKLTAFDIFCRSNRLEVSAQNPELSNQQIAQVLSEKWNQLSSEEKAVFKNMLDRDYPQDVKKKEKLGRRVSLNLSQEKSRPSPLKSQKEKMKPKVKEKVVTFNIEHVKNSYQNSNNKNPTSESLILISHLAPGIWIGAREKKLSILNTFRLQETVIYFRLLETFKFECDPLVLPKDISARNLGDENMKVLIHLSNSDNNLNIISDEKLTANGFNIRFSRGETNEFSAKIVGITSQIAFYGIPDLKELLQLVRDNGLSSKMSECRPRKIELYLQSEANRISRQSPAFKRVQDVEDLLRQKSCLPVNCNECIHQKPFFNEVYDFMSI